MFECLGNEVVEVLIEKRFSVASKADCLRQIFDNSKPVEVLG